MAADPLRGHQCSDGDGQDRELGNEPGAGSQVVENLTEGELGEPAGDEEDGGQGCRVSRIHLKPAFRLAARYGSPNGPAIDPHDLPGQEFRGRADEEAADASD